MSVSCYPKLFFAAAVAAALASPEVAVHAFVPVVVVVRPIVGSPPWPVQRSIARRMSDSSRFLPDKEEDEKLGATERLLLERKYRKEAGLVQEYGRTIKKDGLDPVRAAVWALFHLSQDVIFPLLGAALLMSLTLTMAGYGYYFDASGFHVDSVQHIGQMRLLQAETARFAAAETMMR